jgi:hypothetical protein
LAGTPNTMAEDTLTYVKGTAVVNLGWDTEYHG